LEVLSPGLHKKKVVVVKRGNKILAQSKKNSAEPFRSKLIRWRCRSGRQTSQQRSFRRWSRSWPL